MVYQMPTKLGVSLGIRLAVGDLGWVDPCEPADPTERNESILYYQVATADRWETEEMLQEARPKAVYPSWEQADARAWLKIHRLMDHLETGATTTETDRQEGETTMTRI